jgi:hypothetical protein
LRAAGFLAATGFLAAAGVGDAGVASSRAPRASCCGRRRAAPASPADFLPARRGGIIDQDVLALTLVANLHECANFVSTLHRSKPVKLVAGAAAQGTGAQCFTLDLSLLFVLNEYVAKKKNTGFEVVISTKASRESAETANLMPLISLMKPKLVPKNYDSCRTTSSTC